MGLIIPKLSYAKKIDNIIKGKLPAKIEKKTHPIENYLSGIGKIDLNSRDANKLLVLLIEFQEDDDPQSTGNGKFVQDPGSYPLQIGKPPHDHEYFENQLEALRYYYLAVSYGSFDVDTDVFPQSSPGDFQAYTLPNEMSYYNPPGADVDLMISRFEEYFLDCFSVADFVSPEIDFGDYEHFMFIHAGADWQHDILGDTPADMPSFYIVVGDGKEAIVDNGDVTIDHACNIPETITQDIETDDTGFIPEVYNYGVINAVMVHEFGHSIGFVDLYNTKNHTPQVGFYDIMDSGGSILLGFPYDENGDEEADIVYFIEGAIPVFPSVWSRTLYFEDTYRERGILKDISDFNFDENITVLPAEKIFDASSITDNSAYFVKIPLSDTEYVLVENRQVDPDGDGWTVLIATEDERVILAPSSTNPSDPNPNYEYDYLLPGWMDVDGNCFGGGLLIWHIDEKILEENNNFENNTVNIYHAHRAVKIIEADNIDDIGNPYSMYWWGTAYEPYFQYMPILDEDGYFVDWDDESIVNPNGDMEFIGTIFNESLSAISKPALLTNEGDPSFFSIYDISSYSIEPLVERSMTFKFGTQLFDETKKIAEFDTLKAIGYAGTSLGFPTFPVLRDSALNFFSLLDEHWADNFSITTYFDKTPTQPIISVDRDLDGEDEYNIISNYILSQVTTSTIQFTAFTEIITDAPLFIDQDESWLEHSYIVPAADSLYIFFQNELIPEEAFKFEIPGAKCAFDGEYIIAATTDRIHFIPDVMLDGAISYEVHIDNYDTNYTSVCYKDIVNPAYDATFVQDNNGNIYRIKEGNAEKIFSLYPYTSAKPSQLALGNILDDGQVYLVFGAENRAFAITLNGTLAPGFPAYLDDMSIKPESYPRIIKFDDKPVLLFEEDNGYIAVGTDAKFHIEYSFFWQKTNVSDQFYWDEQSERLYYIYSDINSNLFSSYIENIPEDPVIWNGYRNNDHSIYYGEIEYQPDDSKRLSAFAFPNPAKSGEVRIKVSNAKDNIDLKIFDIAGNIVHRSKVEKEENDDQDIRWNTSKIATGVYFGIVKSSGEVKKIRVAIIN